MMNEYYYKVAGRVFGIVSTLSDALQKGLAPYEPFSVSQPGTGGEQPLFLFLPDNEIGVPSEPAESTFRYPLATGSCTVEIRGQGKHWSWRIDEPVSGSQYRMSVSREPSGTLRFYSDVLTGTKIAFYALDHLLVSAYSLSALLQETLLIHASTIVHNGFAVLFLGESGTGKSTHTRLWLENIAGCELLNDDAPAVRFADGKAIACGTPWSGKTPCYKAEEYPVIAFVRLRQAPHNRITRLGASEGFGALLPSTMPFLQQREEELDPVCDMLSQALLGVPVYRLDCLPDPAAALLSFETVIPDCLRRS